MIRAHSLCLAVGVPSSDKWYWAGSTPFPDLHDKWFWRFLICFRRGREEIARQGMWEQISHVPRLLDNCWKMTKCWRYSVLTLKQPFFISGGRGSDGASGGLWVLVVSGERGGCPSFSSGRCLMDNHLSLLHHAPYPSILLCVCVGSGIQSFFHAIPPQHILSLTSQWQLFYLFMLRITSFSQSELSFNLCVCVGIIMD